MKRRLPFILGGALFVVALPAVLSPYLPTGGLGLVGLILGGVVLSFVGQARWLNYDQSWDLRILFTKDAWLHPWRVRKHARSLSEERQSASGR